MLGSPPRVGIAQPPERRHLHETSLPIGSTAPALTPTIPMEMLQGDVLQNMVEPLSYSTKIPDFHGDLLITAQIEVGGEHGLPLLGRQHLVEHQCVERQ